MTFALHRVFLGLFLILAAFPVLALEPEERLNDPILEARARALSQEIRCMVCQNQSIDDSDADLARDLRRIVREKIAAGDTDATIKAYLVARYGDFILLKPPLRWITLFLWATPILVLILGGLGLFFIFRRRPRSSLQALTTDEQMRLAQLLKDR